MIATVTIGVLRQGPPTRDPVTNNEIPGAVVRTDVPGCLVSPRSSSEIGGPTVLSGVTVLTPEGADVQASDRLDVAGVVYQVDGEVGRWPGGVEVHGRRASDL